MLRPIDYCHTLDMDSRSWTMSARVLPVKIEMVLSNYGLF